LEEAAPAPRQRWEPPDSLDRLERWLADLKGRHPDAQVKLKADPRSRFAVAFDILETFRAAGYPRVAFAGISAREVTSLLRGAHR
jgi:biopolymer transport protein ExbD